MADTTVSYKCPNCGAPLSYLPGADKVTCEYCGTELEIKALEELFAKEQERAVKAQEAKEAKWEKENAAGEWSEEELDYLKTLKCSTCGAELVCDENTMATECCYCGNPTMVPSRFSGMLKPDYVIPFKKKKEEAVAALKEFYKGKYLLPSAFTANNRVEAIQPMYVPYWLFDSDVVATASFKAENDLVIDTPDAIVTETSVYDVQREGLMNFARIPVDGSKKMDDTWMESIEPYDYSEMVPFSSAYLTGYLADRYDVTSDECAERVDERIRATAAQVMEGQIDGYMRHQMEDISVLKENGTVSYALAPVWILTTRYKDKPYTFLMNGQTGKVVGELPVDSTKAVTYPGAVFLILLPILYFVVKSLLV